MHALVTLCNLAGFALLAASTARQQDDLFGQALAPRATALLRTGGAAGLLAGLGAAVHAWGWGLGLVVWCGHLSVAAGAVVLALVAWDRRRRR
ncbi:DUF3325 domain-containing protein [Pseudacidovorax intermedius]|uniref:DUF3325 domain-containing protein n=1 Tax=Pseudacidovorax intermedius TaxID=433924 RepID=A0A147GX10_9BURK|nr:DUF3325 domain-containing protein [Pseudacidovorax intermedius]KTT22156.1 hypothetical protein NS331_10205 [Pseudacidovorax intermedius]